MGLRKPINRDWALCAQQAELPRPKPHQVLGLLDPPYGEKYGLETRHCPHSPSSELLGYCRASLRDETPFRLVCNSENVRWGLRDVPPQSGAIMLGTA